MEIEGKADALSRPPELEQKLVKHGGGGAWPKSLMSTTHWRMMAEERAGDNGAWAVEGAVRLGVAISEAGVTYDVCGCP